MENIRNLCGGLRSFRKGRRGAFASIELLLAIVINAVHAAVLLPAVPVSGPGAKPMRWLGNKKQVQQRWQSDNLPPMGVLRVPGSGMTTHFPD
jgi:hypothetical protein